MREIYPSIESPKRHDTLAKIVAPLAFTAAIASGCGVMETSPGDGSDDHPVGAQEYTAQCTASTYSNYKRTAIQNGRRVASLKVHIDTRDVGTISDLNPHPKATKVRLMGRNSASQLSDARPLRDSEADITLAASDLRFETQAYIDGTWQTCGESQPTKAGSLPLYSNTPKQSNDELPRSVNAGL